MATQALLSLCLSSLPKVVGEIFYNPKHIPRPNTTSAQSDRVAMLHPTRSGCKELTNFCFALIQTYRLITDLEQCVLLTPLNGVLLEKQTGS